MCGGTVPGALYGRLMVFRTGELFAGGESICEGVPGMVKCGYVDSLPPAFCFWDLARAFALCAFDGYVMK